MRFICLIVMVFALLASGCGKGPQGDPGSPGAPGASYSAPAADPVSAEIQSVVDDENAYRLGLGQTMLSQGLSCTLYTFTSGSTILTGDPLVGLTQVATFLLQNSFNQQNSNVSDGLNVLPPALMANPLYQNHIKLRCTGYLVVTDTDYYEFDLYSDDGSLLYLDGALLINNDGNHGITLKSGTKYLRKGVH